jgi:hypothetical protein
MHLPFTLQHLAEAHCSTGLDLEGAAYPEGLDFYQLNLLGARGPATSPGLNAAFANCWMPPDRARLNRHRDCHLHFAKYLGLR